MTHEVLPAQDVADADPNTTDDNEDDKDADTGTAPFGDGLGNDRLTYSLEWGGREVFRDRG